MATKLTTAIPLGSVADEYEFLGLHLDLVADQITVHFAYRDKNGKTLETKSVTGTFSVAGVVNGDLAALRNRVTSWLKARSEIN